MRLPIGLRRYAIIAGFLIALSLLVAACGSSGGSSSSAESTASESTPASSGESEESNTEPTESSGVEEEEVESILAEATAPAKWEGPTEPDPAAANKHILQLTTFAAATGEIPLREGGEEAAKAIGWKLTYVDGNGTPQGYEAGIQQALNEQVDGVVLNGIDTNLVPKGLKELKAAGIPVVAESNTNEPKEELWLGNIGYNTEKEAKYLAAQVAKESNGEAKILTVNDTEYGIVNQRQELFEAALPELCPGCEIAAQSEMQVTELETKLEPKVAALLQANPSVNYIYAPYDSAAVPMVAAVKQAGLENEIKIVSYGGNEQNVEYLRNKEIQTATIANANQWQSWEAVDVLNRYFNEQEIPQNAFNTDPIKLLTWENAPAKGEVFEGDEADYKGHYEKLWRVK
jgi:ribose transport system substrate-binding protein